MGRWYGLMSGKRQPLSAHIDRDDIPLLCCRCSCATSQETINAVWCMIFRVRQPQRHRTSMSMSKASLPMPTGVLFLVILNMSVHPCIYVCVCVCQCSGSFSAGCGARGRRRDLLRHHVGVSELDVDPSVRQQEWTSIHSQHCRCGTAIMPCL